VPSAFDGSEDPEDDVDDRLRAVDRHIVATLRDVCATRVRRALDRSSPRPVDTRGRFRVHGAGREHVHGNCGQIGTIAAQSALGRRVVVSRGWADLSVGDGGADCLTVGEINQQALFKRVAAVVHHGGAGTTTAAALAGAAQVIVPQLYDQHYWAERVQSLGIGAAHAPGTPTADSLAVALETALHPDVALRAKSIAVQVRRDGARIAAEHVAGRDAA